MKVTQFQSPSSQPMRAPRIPAPKKPDPKTDEDTVERGFKPFSKIDMANLGAGAVVGAVGIGGPASLGMGAVKAFCSGNHLVGVGLSLVAVGTAAAAVVPSLAIATMSSDGGDRNGIRGYVAGAVLTTLVAAKAIF